MHSLLIVSLLAFAIGSGFAPWVYQEPVALQLTAPSLAEYVKFLAEDRQGLLKGQRLYFLCPLAVVSLSLPLISGHHTLNLHPLLSILLRLAVIPCALTLLSPIWAPGVLLHQEFRLQTLVAVAALGLTLIAPLFQPVPLKWLVSVIAGCAGIGLALALWQFDLCREAIMSTYASPIILGWGGWLALAGGGGLCVLAGWGWTR